MDNIAAWLRRFREYGDILCQIKAAQDILQAKVNPIWPRLSAGTGSGSSGRSGVNNPFQPFYHHSPSDI